MEELWKSRPEARLEDLDTLGAEVLGEVQPVALRYESADQYQVGAPPGKAVSGWGTGSKGNTESQYHGSCMNAALQTAVLCLLFGSTPCVRLAAASPRLCK